jgi:hypothetical protein
LRQNIIYLSVHSGKDAEGWTLARSRNKVDTYVMDKMLKGRNKKDYQSRVVKTVGRVPVSPETFVQEYLDFNGRRRWEPLFAEGKVIMKLGGTSRILYRSSGSPLKSVYPFAIPRAS